MILSFLITLVNRTQKRILEAIGHPAQAHTVQEIAEVQTVMAGKVELMQKVSKIWLQLGLY